jgi:hypothetical protein
MGNALQPPLNTCYYLLDYLVSVANKKPDDKSDIVVGGIITFIVRKIGVGEEASGINKIEGNIRLNLDTLTSMFFLKPYGQCHNYQYEWKVNKANCLIILPNPDITNPEVVENLLSVGTNPHVQNDGDGGDEEEEGAHLHHEQEAGGNYDDEWWVWMQTEVQRISIEQQRQGVEISDGINRKCTVYRSSNKREYRSDRELFNSINFNLMIRREESCKVEGFSWLKVNIIIKGAL